MEARWNCRGTEGECHASEQARRVQGQVGACFSMPLLPPLFSTRKLAGERNSQILEYPDEQESKKREWQQHSVRHDMSHS